MVLSKVKVEILMAQKGLTQIVLAEKAEMSRVNLSSLLNGKNCRPITVSKIARALEVDALEIVELQELKGVVCNGQQTDVQS